MLFAKCHPDRKLYARGMCSACWQRQRYQTRPDIRARCKAYWQKRYASNRSKVMARLKLYYAENRAKLREKRKARYYNHERQGDVKCMSALATTDTLKRNASPISDSPVNVQAEGGASIKNWWLLDDKELPRTWRQKAA